MKALLCATRLPSLITAIGALPLFIYVIFPALHVMPPVFMQMYVYSILSFIAGINWIMALEHHRWWILVWSVALSIIPLVFLLFNHFSYLTTDGVWWGLILLLWLALLHDYIHRKKIMLQYFFCFRRSGTIFLTVAILLNIFVK